MAHQTIKISTQLRNLEVEKKLAGLYKMTHKNHEKTFDIREQKDWLSLELHMEVKWRASQNY